MFYLSEEDQQLLKDLAWKFKFGFGSEESFMVFWEDRMNVYYLDKPKPTVSFTEDKHATGISFTFPLTTFST